MATGFKNLETILKGMTDHLRDAGSRLKGKLFLQTLTAVSAAIAGGYIDLAQGRDLFFIHSSYGADLDRRINDLGMFRNQGAKSSGALIALAATGDTVVAGTLLVDRDTGVMVEVLQTRALLPGIPAVIPVLALEVGESGNLSEGQALEDVGGRLTDVTFHVGTDGLNAEGEPVGNLRGGIDRESDEEVKKRFPDYLKSQARGTIFAVRQALLATPGVSNLIIENAKPVPGYFRISLADDAGTISPQLEAAVEATLDAWASAGYGFVIQTILRRQVDVSVIAYVRDATLSPATVQAAIQARVLGLTQSLVLGKSIYRAELLREAFIPEIENLTLVSPVSDTLASASDLLSIGTVSVQVVYL